jgi:hypothetical protein
MRKMDKKRKLLKTTDLFLLTTEEHREKSSADYADNFKKHLRHLRTNFKNNLWLDKKPVIRSYLKINKTELFPKRL